MESSIARLRVALARKPALAAAAGAAALVAILIALLLRRDSRIALYASPLRPEQVAEVAQTLSSWNAPYLVEGDSIRVDAGRRNDLLLRLSLAGVPHAHVETRSEALAKASALTPQSVIDSEQLEGLAGEIALGLRGVAGIRDAHVIIAPARPPTFADETAHEASASVRLSLDPGTKLQARTLLGIRAFVAAGVAGLDAARVALLDDRGATLGDDESGPAPSERDGLEASLQSALDTAFGAGATIVRVHARSTQLSVAIAVDSARTLDLAKIRSLAAATLGIDVQRGDALDVEEVAFTAAAAQAPSSAATVIAGLAAVLPPVLFALCAAAATLAAAKPLALLFSAVAARRRAERAQRAVAGQRGVAGYEPSQVHGVLRGEPPHTAAAIISALPAATATAVLELYPPEERAAIVRRMARPASRVVPDLESVLRRA